MLSVPGEYPFWWKYGGRRDFWVARLDLIEASIKEYALKPLDAKFLNYDAQSMAGMARQNVEVTEVIRPRPFPGGMRIPHFHFAGDVFLLNQEQWAGFTTKVMADFRKRLARVEKVGFDQFMDTAEAMIGTFPV